MESLLASSFNLLLLIVFLVVKLRKPLAEFVATRHKTIRDEIQIVNQQLREAQEKYDEFSAKLKAIDAEVANLKEQAKQDTLAMKQRILTEAKRLSGTFISDARVAADGLYWDLRRQLYTELASGVLERAEVLLREKVTGDDRARIRQEFSRQVESVQ